MLPRRTRFTATGEGRRTPPLVSMSTMTDQIDFVCIRGDHQVTTPVEGLTVHGENWAYCPSARTNGHEWRSCRETGLQAHVILRHRE